VIRMSVNQLDRQEKATKQARQHLKERGITYPVFDAKLSPEENYGALLSYAEQEAALVVQFMREPSGPRPLVLDTTKERRPYND
jgi:hypothetical protein